MARPMMLLEDMTQVTHGKLKQSPQATREPQFAIESLCTFELATTYT